MIYSKLLPITAYMLFLSSTFPGILAEIKIMEKHTKRQHITTDLPYKLLTGTARNSRSKTELPTRFSWLKHKGKNYLTKSMNQHLPTYCGSCWAFAAVTSIADRIKIIRMGLLSDDGDDNNDAYDKDGSYPDVALSIQFLLNCGGEIAGSCHGGSVTGAFQFIKETGFIPFETCQPYMGCSSDSTEDLCKHVDTQCTSINTCKTCTRKSPSGMGGVCNPVSQFPHARIDEYGGYRLKDSNSTDDHIFAVKAELYLRGPVATGIAGHYLHNYTGGIIYDDQSLRDIKTTHAVSIVGWDIDNETGVEYWIIRNSWGEYWGEMSFFRLELGKNMLGVESHISWATVLDFSTKNVPCFENAQNCNSAAFNFMRGNGQMS